MIATQNPVEQSGTFELPEAQLDRFLLCHRLDYPSPQEEHEILRRNMRLGVRRQDKGAVARSEFDVMAEGPVATIDDLVQAMELVHEIHVSETFTSHVIDLVERTRHHPHVDLGCSPARASRWSKRPGLELDPWPVVRRARGSLCPGRGCHAASHRLTYKPAEGLTGTDVLRSLLN